MEIPGKKDRVPHVPLRDVSIRADTRDRHPFWHRPFDSDQDHRNPCKVGTGRPRPVLRCHDESPREVLCVLFHPEKPPSRVFSRYGLSDTEANRQARDIGGACRQGHCRQDLCLPRTPGRRYWGTILPDYCCCPGGGTPPKKTQGGPDSCYSLPGTRYKTPADETVSWDGLRGTA